MNGLICFLQSFIGGEKNFSNPKEKEKQKKSNSKVIPMENGKPQKAPRAVLNKVSITEREKAKKDLILNFRKAYNASSELKKMVKNSGGDIERCQIQAIHSQMKLVAKMLENLKK